MFRNLGWKISAIVLAYALWLAAIEEPLAIRQLDVPVDFVNLGPTLAIARNRPSSIVVRVQAPEPVAKDLQSTDVLVRVDLGGLGQGKHNIRLSPEGRSIVTRRFGIKVTEIFPPSLELTLEPKLAAQVPVKAELREAPADGFEVGDVRVEPGVMRIEGPRSAVKATTEARTREISLAGHKTTFEQMAWVDIANPDVRIVGEPRVRVTVNVTEILGEKVFADFPVALLNSSADARAEPTEVRLSVRGPARLLSRLKREDLVAFVDLRGLASRKESYQLPVQLDFTRDLFREGLHGGSATPADIAVRIPAQKPMRSPEAR